MNTDNNLYLISGEHSNSLKSIPMVWAQVTKTQAMKLFNSHTEKKDSQQRETATYRTGEGYLQTVYLIRVNIQTI